MYTNENKCSFTLIDKVELIKCFLLTGDDIRPYRAVQTDANTGNHRLLATSDAAPAFI